MKRLLPLALAFILAACGTHDSNVASAPGFKNGKPVSPYIKMGKPYEVNGKTYYPEHDPNYSETGMASWYGPGFHGGTTANGERFNANDMTAAHRTLPIPSLVKVTHAKSGRTTIVRINDRGPFAHNRIIDLSKAAASRIGMLGEGVAKVRIEYLPAESERYVELLGQGRHPSNINLEQDVLRVTGERSYADASQTDNRSWFDRLNPISSAHAEEPANIQMASAAEVIPVQTQATQELPPLDSTPPATLPVAKPAVLEPAPSPALTVTPAVAAPEDTGTIPQPAATTERSPFDLLPEGEKVAQPVTEPVERVTYYKPAELIGGYFVQLGVYGNQQNAINMKERFEDDATVTIEKVGNLNRVRMGPFKTQAEALKLQSLARQNGVSDAKIIKL